MKNVILITLLAAVSAPSFAQSSGATETGIRYNHVGVGYQNQNPSDASAITGYGVSGSYLFDQNAYVFGAYGMGSGSDFDVDNLSLGGGLRMGVAQNTDVVGELSYERTAVKADDGKATFTGYKARGIVRTMLTPDIEGSAYIGYQHQTDFVKGMLYGIGAAYYFNADFSVRATWQKLNDSESGNPTQYSIGVAYHF